MMNSNRVVKIEMFSLLFQCHSRLVETILIANMEELVLVFILIKVNACVRSAGLVAYVKVRIRRWWLMFRTI